MLRVALTGGVGSGKSTAAAMLRGFGAYVSSSDEVARSLMAPGAEVFLAMVKHFGTGVLAADGSLDRNALARIAFEDGRVEELNRMVHPRVIAWQARWCDQVFRDDSQAIAVMESALVFETKHGASSTDGAPWSARFDRVAVVTSALALRRERYVARLGGTADAAADFDRRSRAQWTDEAKTSRADYVLVNDGSMEDLRDATARLWRVLKAESEKRWAATSQPGAV